MGLNLVTARARTRGKSPVEFDYQAVGRLSPRKVTDKNGNPILMSVDSKNDKGEVVKGEQVKYELKKDKDGKESLPFENDSEGNPIAPEGTRFVEVDDVISSGLTESMQEVLDLAGSLSEKERGYVNVTDAEGKVSQVAKTPLQCIIDWSLDGFNYLSRKNAAPVTEQVTEDELTPVTLALVSAKIMTEQEATNWRRTVTTTAKMLEQNRMDFAKVTPQYKKLIASGWKPATVAA